MRTIPRHPSVANLPENECEPFYRKERIVRDLLHRHVLDNSCISRAARKLDIPRNRVTAFVEGYARYSEVYGEGNAVDYFRSRGRTVPPQNLSKRPRIYWWLVLLLPLWYIVVFVAELKAQVSSKVPKLPPRHPRVIILPEHKRKKYFHKERRIQELLQLHEAKVWAPLGTRREAVKREFGLSTRRLDAIIAAYVTYRDAYGEECAVDFFVPNIQRHASIAELDPEAQKPYLDKEKYFKELLDLRAKNNGELPHRKREKAAEHLKVTGRRVDQQLKEYVDYAELFGAENAVDYFRPLPAGRKAATTMTALQQAAVRFALLKRSRMVVIEEERHVKDIEYSLRDVYNFASAVCDEAGDPLPSEDTVGRFIKGIKESHPTIHELGLWGKDAVERKFIPKRANKVYRADARWQSDARDLPLYALVDGKPCPLCLLIIYDDFTGYIIWWKLVAKVYRDGGGRPRRNSFTLRDVCSLLATAMYVTGRMPDEVYTDNGSQYIALRALLPYLINSQGKFPIMVNSRPGKPWGRGKVERGLGRVNELLKRMPGSYKKGERLSINKARLEALSLEKVIKIFAEHFEHINKRPQRRKPSRYDQYWSAISSPRPSFARMIHLDIDSKPDWVPINHWCFHTLGQAYEPKLRQDESNRDVYRLWLDAATSEKPIRIYALKLDIGWRVEVHLVGEKDSAWLEAVPKGSEETDQHNHDQNAALKDAVTDWRAILSGDESLLRAHCRALPELNPATGEYVVPQRGDTAEGIAGQPPSSEMLSTIEPNGANNGTSPATTSTSVEATTSTAGDGTTIPANSPTRRPRPPQMRGDRSQPALQSSSALDLSQLPDIDELFEHYRTERAN
jgi:hypothetical protein